MALIILAAFFLDLAVGDPLFLPHPVVGMGRLISCLEAVLTRYAKSDTAKLWAGAALAFLVVGISTSLVFFVLLLARHYSRPLYVILQIYFVYTTLAARGLADAALKVHHALKKRDLAAARSFVQRIVGRDTGALDEGGIIRAAVETVAENTVDAVIAPLFYAFLGGAVLAVAYRAVNTLDAMVGYKNERYQFLGRASARADDLANFLPARIAGLLMVPASFIAGHSPWRTLVTMRKYGSHHPSPNSGITEAAMAGALKVRLGGPVSYGGKLADHAYLGDAAGEPGYMHIAQAVTVMLVTSGLGLAAGIALRLIFTHQVPNVF